MYLQRYLQGPGPFDQLNEPIPQQSAMSAAEEKRTQENTVARPCRKDASSQCPHCVLLFYCVIRHRTAEKREKMQQTILLANFRCVNEDSIYVTEVANVTMQ